MEYKSEYKEEKEREISLRNVVFFVWDRLALLFIVGLLCSAVAMVYNYNQQKSINPESQAKAEINAIIDQNRTAYYNKSTEYKPYSYEEPSSNTVNSIARIFIDYNFQKIENNTNMDYSAMVVKAQNDAIQIMVSDDSLCMVIDELNLNSYNDMRDITPDELRWMINGYSDGTGVIQVIVTDINPERAKSIAEKTIGIFLQKAEDYSFIDEAKILDEPSLPRGGYRPVSTGIDKKILLKYAIFGFIGGIILVSVVLVFIYILRGAVQSEDDLYYADARCVGIIKKNNNKEDYRKITNNIIVAKDVNVVSFVPIDKYSENTSIVNNIMEDLEAFGKKVVLLKAQDSESIKEQIEQNYNKSDYILVMSRNIKEYGEATMCVTYSDMAIGISTYEKTRINSIISFINKMSEFENKTVGVIINSAKHV